MEQPAASAAEIFRIGPPAGKFHGTNAPTGPTGVTRTDRISSGPDDPAVGPAPLLGVPLQPGRRPVHLAGRLRERLALLQGHHPADLVRPLVQQRRRLEQDPRPEVRPGVAPLGKRGPGRRDRGVDVGGLGERHPAEDLLGGGVDDVVTAAAGTAGPLAVDVELDVGVFRAHQ
jgi:hypothetical protein